MTVKRRLLVLLAVLAALTVGCYPRQGEWPPDAPQPDGWNCWHDLNDYMVIDCNSFYSTTYAQILYKPWYPHIRAVFYPTIIAAPRSPR